MIRILMVDDHPVALSGIRVTVAGCVPAAEIGEASTVPAALELLRGASWDLLILDLGLPAPGGLGLLTEVRRLWPTLRVLVVSAFTETEYAVTCLKQGAAGYVAKTSGPAELSGAVLKVLSGGTYVSPATAERLASSLARPDEAGGTPEVLSIRELQVLRAVASGRSSKEIATELNVAERTIGTYRARIAGKLGLNSAVEITRYAIRNGLVE